MATDFHAIANGVSDNYLLKDDVCKSVTSLCSDDPNKNDEEDTLNILMRVFFHFIDFFLFLYEQYFYLIGIILASLYVVYHYNVKHSKRVFSSFFDNFHEDNINFVKFLLGFVLPINLTKALGKHVYYTTAIGVIFWLVDLLIIPGENIINWEQVLTFSISAGFLVALNAVKNIGEAIQKQIDLENKNIFKHHDIVEIGEYFGKIEDFDAEQIIIIELKKPGEGDELESINFSAKERETGMKMYIPVNYVCENVVKVLCLKHKHRGRIKSNSSTAAASTGDSNLEAVGSSNSNSSDENAQLDRKSTSPQISKWEEFMALNIVQKWIDLRIDLAELARNETEFYYQFVNFNRILFVTLFVFGVYFSNAFMVIVAEFLMLFAFHNRLRLFKFENRYNEQYQSAFRVIDIIWRKFKLSIIALLILAPLYTLNRKELQIDCFSRYKTPETCMFMGTFNQNQQSSSSDALNAKQDEDIPSIKELQKKLWEDLIPKCLSGEDLLDRQNSDCDALRVRCSLESTSSNLADDEFCSNYWELLIPKCLLSKDKLSEWPKSDCDQLEKLCKMETRFILAESQVDFCIKILKENVEPNVTPAEENVCATDLEQPAIDQNTPKQEGEEEIVIID